MSPRRPPERIPVASLAIAALVGHLVVAARLAATYGGCVYPPVAPPAGAYAEGWLRLLVWFGALLAALAAEGVLLRRVLARAWRHDGPTEGAAHARPARNCAACGAEDEPGFEVCWSCQHIRLNV